MLGKRKLYVNVSKIHINGDPVVLYNYIVDINKCVEYLTMETIVIRNTLVKYAQIDSTEQFGKMVENVGDLSKVLIVESENFNELQLQVWKLCDNMERFIEKTNPIPHNFKHFGTGKVDASVREKVFHFSIDDYIYLYNSLMNYLTNVANACVKLQHSAVAAETIWRDDQYRIFLDVVNEIVMVIKKGGKQLQDYAIKLKKLILQLQN